MKKLILIGALALAGCASNVTMSVHKIEVREV